VELRDFKKGKIFTLSLGVTRAFTFAYALCYLFKG
jgi:hypothetical protein